MFRITATSNNRVWLAIIVRVRSYRSRFYYVHSLRLRQQMQPIFVASIGGMCRVYIAFFFLGQSRISN